MRAVGRAVSAAASSQQRKYVLVSVLACDDQQRRSRLRARHDDYRQRAVARRDIAREAADRPRRVQRAVGGGDERVVESLDAATGHGRPARGCCCCCGLRRRLCGGHAAGDTAAACAYGARDAVQAVHRRPVEASCAVPSSTSATPAASLLTLQNAGRGPKFFTIFRSGRGAICKIDDHDVSGTKSQAVGAAAENGGAKRSGGVA